MLLICKPVSEDSAVIENIALRKYKTERHSKYLLGTAIIVCLFYFT